MSSLLWTQRSITEEDQKSEIPVRERGEAVRWDMTETDKRTGPGAGREAAGEVGAGAGARAERTAGTPAGETGPEDPGSRAGRRMTGGRGARPSCRNSPGSRLTPGWPCRPPDNNHTRDIQLTRPRYHRQLPARPSLQDIRASIHLHLLDIPRARDIPSNMIETKIERKIGTIDVERRTGGSAGRKTAAMTERRRKSKDRSLRNNGRNC